MAKSKEIAIVYMVAGMSSRFGGKIKQFARVGPNGETLIEYSINQALKAGFNKIIFIIGNMTEEPFKKMFHSRYKGVPILYTKQTFNPEIRDKPWGTVDAVCTIKSIIDCPFVVCNGDDIYGENTFKILAEHLRNPENKGICASVGYRLGDVLPEQGTTNRGIFQVDSECNVTNMEERFNLTRENISSLGLNEDDLCSMNCFAFYPEIMNQLTNLLLAFQEKNKGDRKAECLLPVEVSTMLNEKKLEMKLYKTNSKWFGVTNPSDEEIVKEQLKNLIN